MLLITDRGDLSRAELWRDCTVHRLGEPLVRAATASALTCDVALDDAATVQALREALAHLRSSPIMPVHFVLRNKDILAHARANALGATSISVEAFDGCVYTAAEKEAPLGSGRPAVEDDIASAATTLSHIFEAAAARTPIARFDLDHGVAALLRSTREAGIGRWVEIVRRYDDATYQHCLLVAGLTTAFAAHLGLSTAKQRMLAQAALLHDIGKARVPLGILNKAGPLNAAELTAMRKHPADGYYMLARQDGLEPGVLDVVLHHHEMLDGSGYPEGLRREQIADVVRLVTICDIHAALIERRPYRPAMTAAAAYATLVAMGGKLDGPLVEGYRGVADAIDRDGHLAPAAGA